MKMGALNVISVLSVCIFSCVLCEDVKVSSPVGEIIGTLSTILFNGQSYNITSFYAIPFAEPAVCPRRFAKPMKKAKFMSAFNATVLDMTACPQNVKWAEGLDELPVSEDCLNLNIFVPGKPSQNSSKAVMIFIYGGGFQFGFQSTYISTALPALHDVIYITINYRVSLYGFLASKKFNLKGNYGLWDQHMAIKWVHDNIAAFGGDPERVTLFGESAGASAVMYQALFKGNKGLIHRIITQSGTVGADFAYSKYPDMMFDDIATRSGCMKETFEKTIACLRDTNTDTYEGLLRLKDNFSPIKDDDFVTFNPQSIFNDHSGMSADAVVNFAEIDVVIGFNSDEGYLELNHLASLYNENIMQIPEGVSEEQFKRILKLFLTNVNKTSDDAVMKSIMHQYSDWEDLDSSLSRRSMLLDVMKDFTYTVPALQALNAHANNGSKGNTYMYYFDQKSNFSHSPDWVEGADHAEEIPFVLGFPSMFMFVYGIYSEDPATLMSAEDLDQSMAMMKYWTHFAKTGNPNDATDITLTYWPQYQAPIKSYISFRAGDSTVSSGRHFRNELSYWTEIFPDWIKTVEAAKKVDETNKCVTDSSGVVQLSTTLMIMYSLYWL